MFKSAYDAGWRAGCQYRVTIVRGDGTKTIHIPACPYEKWWQVFHRASWWKGYDDGMKYYLTNYRKGSNYARR